MPANPLKARIILADPVIDAICDALNIDKNCVHQIYLELNAGQPIQAEISMFGTESFNVIDWAEALKGATLRDIQ